MDQTTPSATARNKRPKQHLNPICTSAQSRENTKTTNKKFMADHAKNWTLNVPLCSTHQKSERTKIKAQPTKKERQKRITNRHTAKSRRRREIGSNDPRRDSKARAAKATPKSYLYISTKPGKQKTTAKNYGRPRENWTLSVPLQHAKKRKRTKKRSATNRGKAKKRKTSSHIAKPRRGVEIRSNDPRRSSKAKATPKFYLYIRTKPGKQKTTKPKLMADRENNWTLSVPLHHTTKTKKTKRNQQRKSKKQKNE